MSIQAYTQLWLQYLVLSSFYLDFNGCCDYCNLDFCWAWYLKEPGPWTEITATPALGLVGYFAKQTLVFHSEIFRFQGWRHGHLWRTLFNHHIRKCRSTQTWTCNPSPSLQNLALDSTSRLTVHFVPLPQLAKFIRNSTTNSHAPPTTSQSLY